jgi:hypothetical protein
LATPSSTNWRIDKSDLVGHLNPFAGVLWSQG